MFNTIWKQIKDKRNVIGYSKTPKLRIKNGIIIPNTSTLRVYVTEKKSINDLRSIDIIPPIIGNFETDVVGLGKVMSLQVDKTAKHRPVPLGISVGNWNITAGSLGMLYEKDGQIVAGSNAHILVEQPELTPNEITEKRILQPGAYHGGKVEDNIVGTYLWHKQIIPSGNSGCAFGNGVAKLLNFFLWIFGREGRMRYTAETSNTIDFATYTLLTDHIIEIADGSLEKEPFIGHLFAGSDTVGIICKSKYIENEGFKSQIPSTEVSIGDTVKGCSFWCFYQTTVEDESGFIQISYGNFTAAFDDVIIIKNDGTIKGGWSGSGWRKL